MPRRTDLSPVVDGLLRLFAISSLTATALLAPNAIQLFDKPLKKYFAKLDERAAAREMNRLLGYMRRKGLVTEDYQHGLAITKKARRRLELADLDAVTIAGPAKWDKQWRLIIYDIPEKYKAERDQFAFRLRQLGCQQLQRSVWIHPFPCEEAVNVLAVSHSIDTYITYFVTAHINNEAALKKRFSHLL